MISDWVNIKFLVKKVSRCGKVSDPISIKKSCSVQMGKLEIHFTELVSKGVARNPTERIQYWTL
jgi:hypothetical protein